MDPQPNDSAERTPACSELIPSLPLLSKVLSWERVSLPSCLQQTRALHPTPVLPTHPRSHVSRWEFFGLPGVGKSTLARALTAWLTTEGKDVLLLPEAVPYAVANLGIALDGLVPFLDEVNGQAETLARETAAAAKQTLATLEILRDPAHLQNECYRFVLAARADRRHPATDALDALSASVRRGKWNDEAAEDIGSVLLNTHRALHTPPVGPWQLGHFVLTSSDPLEDLELSRTRQSDGSRDSRLITADSTLLAAYLSAIRCVERGASAQPTSRSRAVIDPRRPRAEVFEVATVALRHSLSRT